MILHFYIRIAPGRWKFRYSNRVAGVAEWAIERKQNPGFVILPQKVKV